MRLEDKIGVNPFCVEGTALPITLGELIAFYDTAVAISGAPKKRQSPSSQLRRRRDPSAASAVSSKTN
jgi:hypothetical protein